MNSHQALIMLIVAVGVAVGAALVVLNTASDFTDTPSQHPPAHTRIISATGGDVSDGTINIVRFEVVTDKPVPLNNTLITINVRNASIDYPLAQAD